MELKDIKSVYDDLSKIDTNSIVENPYRYLGLRGDK